MYLRRARLFIIVAQGVFLLATVFRGGGFCDVERMSIDEVIFQNGHPLTAHVTVRGKKSGMMKDLRLRVYVDEEELIEVKGPPGKNTFSVQSYNPPAIGANSIAMLFDTSLSVDSALWERGRETIITFLEKMDARDQVMLISFGSETKDIIEFTEDKVAIKNAILELYPSEKKTLLYDAVYRAIQALPKVASGNRTVVLLTDGIDDGSYLTDEDCIDLIKRLAAPVIVLDVGPRLGRPSLFSKRLAKISGGRYLRVEKLLQPEINDLIGASQISYAVSLDHPKLREPGFYNLKLAVWDVAKKASVIETSKQVHIPFNKAGHGLAFMVSMVVLLLIITGFTVYRKIMRRKTSPVELGELRESVKILQEETQKLEEKIWEYGDSREEKMKRWKDVCHETARKAVSVLKSCWLERENPSIDMIYNELVTNLKTIGIEVINPGLGQEIDENDRRYWIREREGATPYRISKVIYPGYYFRPRLGRVQEAGDEVLLEPAQIEVKGS